MRSVVLILFGFLILICSSFYEGDIWISAAFVFSGLLFIILGYYDLKQSNSRLDKANQDKFKKNIEAYKKSASEVIEINLQLCDVSSKNYFVKKNSSVHTKIQMLDSAFNNHSSETNVKIDSQVVKFTSKSRTFYSTVINMDEDDLKIKLYLEKKTFIYINNYSKGDYFFDLNFLKK